MSSKDFCILGITAVLLAGLMIFGGKNLTQVQPNFMVWLGSGALIGLGVIVPEMSPSNFLIYFGLYEKMSSDISHLNMATVIPLVIGPFYVC